MLNSIERPLWVAVWPFHRYGSSVCTLIPWYCDFTRSVAFWARASYSQGNLLLRWAAQLPFSLESRCVADQSQLFLLRSCSSSHWDLLLGGGGNWDAVMDSWESLASNLVFQTCRASLVMCTAYTTAELLCYHPRWGLAWRWASPLTPAVETVHNTDMHIPMLFNVLVFMFFCFGLQWNRRFYLRLLTIKSSPSSPI